MYPHWSCTTVVRCPTKLVFVVFITLGLFLRIVDGQVDKPASLVINMPLSCVSNLAEVQSYYDAAVKEIKAEPGICSQFPSAINLTYSTSFPSPVPFSDITARLTYFQQYKPSAVFGENDIFIKRICDSFTPIPNYYSTTTIDLTNALVTALSYLNYVENAFTSGAYLNIDLTLAIIDSSEVDKSTPFLSVSTYNLYNGLTQRLSQIRFNGNAKDLISKLVTIQPKNILLLLKYNDSINVLTEAYRYNLFQLQYRWIIMNRNGPRINLDPNVYNVISKNISVFYSEPLYKTPPGPVVDLEHLYLMDAAYLAANYQKRQDCVIDNTNEITLFGGTYSQDYSAPTNSIKLTTFYTIYHNLGKSQVKYVSVNATNSGSSTFDFAIDSVVTKDDILKSMRSKPLTIGAVLGAPFVMQNLSNTTSTTGDVTGLSIDLVDRMLRTLNLSYTVSVLTDVGVFNDSTQQWTGGFGNLARGEIDILVGNVVITSQRSNYFNFINGFKFFTDSILFKNDTNVNSFQIFQFLYPVTWHVWLAIVIGALLVAITLALLNFSYPDKINYGLYESIFVVFGCFFHGITMTPPSRLAGRLLLSSWWLFCLIFTAIYIANYACMFLYSKFIINDINFDTLLTTQKYSFGFVVNTISDSDLKNSNVPTIQQVNMLARYLIDGGMQLSMTSGINAVDGGNYALIADSFTLQYYAWQKCWSVSAQYKAHEYGIGISRTALYKSIFDDVMGQMSRNLIVDNISNVYVPITSNPKCSKSDVITVINNFFKDNISSSDNAMTLQEMIGVFIVLFGGCIIALVMAFLDCLFKISVQRLLERRPPTRHDQLSGLKREFF